MGFELYLGVRVPELAEVCIMDGGVICPKDDVRDPALHYMFSGYIRYCVLPFAPKTYINVKDTGGLIRGVFACIRLGRSGVIMARS